MRPPAPAWCRGSLAFACVAVALLTGCRSDAGEPAPPVEVRHDLAPLTSRFPALAAPVSADWVTWNSADPNDRSIPGPTTYWIDAVVRLEPATAAALMTTYQPRLDGRSPEVHDLLVAELPPGPYHSGAELDRAFSASGWITHVYLQPTADLLVLTAADA